MHLIPWILAGLGVLTVRALWLLVAPHGPCLRCGGRGVIPSGTRRRKRCPVCRGRRRRQRLGARVVHAFFWSVVGAWWMERRRERHREED